MGLGGGMVELGIFFMEGVDRMQGNETKRADVGGIMGCRQAQCIRCIPPGKLVTHGAMYQ